MIRIEKVKNKIKIYSPHNCSFVYKIKKFGSAKWDSYDKCWIISEDDLDAAREIMLKTYGYSDITENETITLRIKVVDVFKEDRDSLFLFNKVIAKGYGRDSGAKVGEDVAILDGFVSTGGSFKNWYTYAKVGTEFILKKVNKNIYEKYKNSYDNLEITVMKNKENFATKEQLLEEKERLLNKLSEIEEKLTELNDNQGKYQDKF